MGHCKFVTVQVQNVKENDKIPIKCFAYIPFLPFLIKRGNDRPCMRCACIIFYHDGMQGIFCFTISLQQKRLATVLIVCHNS